MGSVAASRGKARSPKRRPGGTPRSTSNAVPLYRNSLWLFALFGLSAMVAFWPTYLSRLDQQTTYHPHAHGVTMFLWCAMLVSQAWLIRSGKRDLHARFGAFSYAIVPLMVITTVNFISFRLRGAQQLGEFALYFVSLITNALVAFLILYGLAMLYRSQPAIHARYMIGTISPLFTPVTDRLIGAHMPSLIPLVPRIEEQPILPFAGFMLADVMLVALSVWDWRVNRRAVFPVVLGVLLMYHSSVLTFYRLPFWSAFCAWFATLPLG